MEDDLALRRKRRFYLGLFILTFIIACCAVCILSKPRSILGKLDYNAVVIDISKGGYRVAPELACSNETFDEMIARLRPHAAINGAYYGHDRKPLGDIVCRGKVVCRGFQRQGIGFTSNGKIRFIERKPNHHIDWTGCCSGLACGPRLLRDGKIDINLHRDGFGSAAGKVTAPRCSVGATKDGKLILCVVNDSITLQTLSEAMLALGAVDAVNLDGGSMCALYGNGRCLVEPLQPMSNILAVYKIK